ncbi:MAG: hypothetical protein ABIG28_01280 [archaeon]
MTRRTAQGIMVGALSKSWLRSSNTDVVYRVVGMDEDGRATYEVFRVHDQGRRHRDSRPLVNMLKHYYVAATESEVEGVIAGKRMRPLKR